MLIMMTRFMMVLILLGSQSGCSASPDAPADTCGPIADVALCVSTDFKPEESSLAARVWGRLDCSDPDAIQIVVGDASGDRVGEADLETRTAIIDPTAWDQPLGPGPVIAHEVGHILGYDHSDGACDIMNGSAPSGACHTLTIDGCEYVP